MCAVEGVEGFRRYVQLVRDAFPDFHNTIEDLIAEDDRVAARLRYTGTHSGPLFGVAPTGNPLTDVNASRPDVVEPCLTQEQALAQAPKAVDGRFAVPRILEAE